MTETTIRDPRTDYQELVDVIAALRIADEATESHEKFGRVAHEILAGAPETPEKRHDNGDTRSTL